MKIGLITTLNTNIGDDFIREGICFILEYLFMHHDIEYVTINKHVPFSVYPAFHPAHLVETITRIPYFPGKRLFCDSLDYIFSKINSTYFDQCELIVQCGAPVFWPNCHDNEWAKPLWKNVIGRLHSRIPVLNIATGSCYPWERQPSKFDSTKDERYIKNILGYARLTTVRDSLAQILCRATGIELPLIPCSAFLSGVNREPIFNKSGYVLINYMIGAGHYSWNQEIDNKKWDRVLRELIRRLKKRHRIALLCHNDQEYIAAKYIAPEINIYHPKTTHDYLECVSGSIFAICNRMHASVVLAGLGIPSIAICTDTRLLMVSQIGMPTYYVKDVDVDVLEEEAERMITFRKCEYDRLIALRGQVWNNYISVIKEALHLT